MIGEETCKEQWYPVDNAPYNEFVIRLWDSLLQPLIVSRP